VFADPAPAAIAAGTAIATLCGWQITNAGWLDILNVWRTRQQLRLHALMVILAISPESTFGILKV
jgi:hypothetical protein